MDVTWLETWWLWSGAVVVLGTVLWFRRQNRTYRRLEKTDAQRVERLRARWQVARDDGERRAIEVLLAHIESIQARWFLDARHLNGWAGSRELVGNMAAAYHPDSPDPVTRARIGPLLKGFLELRESLVALTRLPGLGGLMRLRLRHLELLKQAWTKKQAWDASPVGRFFQRFHLYFVIKWATNILRCGDALFWAAKSGGFVFYDVAFKRMLVRWYLSLGEVVLGVYGGPDRAPDLPDEEVLEDMEDLKDPEIPLEEFPPEVRAVVDRSRRELLTAVRFLTWKEIRQIDRQLVEEIATVYHPQAEQPLMEATLFDCLSSLARLCDGISSLQKKPVVSKLLDLRVSHLLKAKETADKVLDSQWFDLLKKYRVGSAVKYSSLAYKAFRRGHPGVLFKDLAYTVLREGGKRWLALYLHGKVAREADRVYGACARPTSSRV
ncbi:MAG: hypothetical protein KC553_11140 [Nitrospina sp.]|nr:hypothetical protein [Nitrospina sp.]